MKRLLFFLLLVLPSAVRAQVDSSVIGFLDPTGTYSLGPIHWDLDADYSYGQVRVKYLGNKRIAVCLFFCKGPPGNRLGIMSDTLYYDHAWAEWRTAEDASCVLRFAFSDKGVNLRQTTDHPDTPCGFGCEVFAEGYFRKTSSRVPVIEDIALSEDRWRATKK